MVLKRALNNLSKDNIFILDSLLYLIVKGELRNG